MLLKDDLKVLWELIYVQFNKLTNLILDKRNKENFQFVDAFQNIFFVISNFKIFKGCKAPHN